MDEPRCPICNKRLVGPEPAGSEHFPFCSRRCQQVDLGHWFDSDYIISTPEPGGDDDQDEEVEEQ